MRSPLICLRRRQTCILQFSNLVRTSCKWRSRTPDHEVSSSRHLSAPCCFHQGRSGRRTRSRTYAIAWRPLEARWSQLREYIDMKWGVIDKDETAKVWDDTDRWWWWTRAGSRQRKTAGRANGSIFRPTLPKGILYNNINSDCFVVSVIRHLCTNYRTMADVNLWLMTHGNKQPGAGWPRWRIGRERRRSSRRRTRTRRFSGRFGWRRTGWRARSRAGNRTRPGATLSTPLGLSAWSAKYTCDWLLP